MKVVRNAIIAGAFLGIIMLSGILAYRTHIISRCLSYLAYPALKINAFLFSDRSAADEQSQIASLSRQLQLAQMQNVRLRAALNHAHDTKSLRLFNKRFQERGQIGQIIARHFSDESHYYLLDVGAKDGIEKDMIVLYNNNLIGKVTDVYPWYSKVALITDHSCKVAACCAQSRAQGIAQGENDASITSLRYVDQLVKVKEGELVLSSGQGMIFPAGFALGKVTGSCADGLYQSVLVQPLCNLQEISYCLVMNR